MTLVSTAPGPTLTMGIPAHGLGVSQMLFSPGHQHRPIEIRTQDCIQPGAGSTVVLAPSPHVPAHKVYSCESYTCCDTVVGVGGGEVLLFHSDALQGLRLQTGCGCKSIVCAAVRRDFSVSSLTLGLAVLSAPSVQVPYSQVSAPEAAPEHRSLLMVEEVHGGGRGWGSIEPT